MVIISSAFKSILSQSKMLFKEPKNLLKGLGWSRWVGEHAHKPPSFVGFHMFLTYIAFPQIMVTPGIMSEFPNLPSVKSIVSLKGNSCIQFLANNFLLFHLQ